MSVTIGAVNNYTGEVVDGILRSKFGETGNAFINKGLIHVEEGIMMQTNLRKSTASAVLTNRLYDPSTAKAGQKSSYEIGDQVLKVYDLMMFADKILPATFEIYWKDLQPTGLLVFEELPDDIKADMISALLGDLAVKYEKAILDGGLTWADPSAPTALELETDPMEGIMLSVKKVGLGGGYIDGTGGAYAVIDESNVEAKIQGLLNACGTRMIRDPRFKLAISDHIYLMLDNALRAKDFKGLDYTDELGYVYNGVQLVVIPTMEANEMFATWMTTGRDSNLWMAVNTKSDETTITIDKETNMGEYYFLKLLFKAGCIIKDIEEFAIYCDFNAKFGFV